LILKSIYPNFEEYKILEFISESLESFFTLVLTGKGQCAYDVIPGREKAWPEKALVTVMLYSGKAEDSLNNLQQIKFFRNVASSDTVCFC
jgi:hypothetical protein